MITPRDRKTVQASKEFPTRCKCKTSSASEFSLYFAGRDVSKLIDPSTLPLHMDVGIPDGASHQPVSSDDTTGVTLGPGGQVQIGGDEGNLSQPPDPDDTFPDGIQASTVDSTPPTPPLTDEPLSQPSSAPELLSGSTLPYVISQIDFSWTETPLVPTAFLTEPASVVSPTNLPLTPIPISFDTILSRPAQSVVPSTIPLSIAIVPSSLILSTLFSSSSPFPQTTDSSSIPNSASTPSSGSTSSAPIPSSIKLLSSATSNYFSSSVASPSISVSSTISQQSASETVIAPPIPANLNVRPPTFYVGIGLGSFVAIALVIALIAWWIRRQTRRRRRSAQTIVPWGHLDNYDDGTLESGHNISEMDKDALAAVNLGSREDLAHFQAWSPHGDRDVGEPKRAPTYSNALLYGSYSYARPGHTPYTDRGYGYPNAEYGFTPTPRHLPSHLIPDDIPARVHRREASLCTYNNVSSAMNRTYGNPKQTASWVQEPLLEVPPPCSMADRLRNVGKHRSGAPEDVPERLPSPTGPNFGKEEFEQWSSSLKSSLVNAFNAVASNLGGSVPYLKDDDGLTAPPKRSIRRRQNTAPDREKGDGIRISRHGSVATTSSKPWTLEEISDGAGVVHLHIPELDDKHALTAQRSLTRRPILSFGDGESISASNDAKGESHVSKPKDPQIALFASSKPKRAFIRPETYFARQKSTETVNVNTVSRSSSIYSALSARSGTLPRRGASGRSRIAKSNLRPGNRDYEEVESVVIAPDTISRLSSNDSSLTMLSAEGSFLGLRSAADAAASRALKERQKKVAEFQIAQSLLK